MATVICPACGVEIAFDRTTHEGDIVECFKCTCQLEVVKKGTRIDVELIENDLSEDLDKPNLEDLE